MKFIKLTLLGAFATSCLFTSGASVVAASTVDTVSVKIKTAVSCAYKGGKKKQCKAVSGKVKKTYCKKMKKAVKLVAKAKNETDLKKVISKKMVGPYFMIRSSFEVKETAITKSHKKMKVTVDSGNNANMGLKPYMSYINRTSTKHKANGEPLNFHYQLRYNLQGECQ